MNDGKASMIQAKRTGLDSPEKNGKVICHVIDEFTSYDKREAEGCPKSVSNCDTVIRLIQKVVERH